MAKKKKKHLSQKIHNKYDVADIIMEYTAALFSDLDFSKELNTLPEDMKEFVENTIFVCTSGWNYAALPPDCGAIMINKFRQTAGDDLLTEEILDMILSIAEEMRNKYPDPDVIIINHKVLITDGKFDFGVQVVSLEKYVQVIREEM